MAFASLRRYDVQARYALGLAIASIPPFVGAAFLAMRNYEPQLGQIVYGQGGFFLPAFAGCALLSIAPAALGFVLGLNSAGQRRNDNSRRSWIGFFVGGAIVSLDIVLLIAFVMLRLERPI